MNNTAQLKQTKAIQTNQGKINTLTATNKLVTFTASQRQHIKKTM